MKNKKIVFMGTPAIAASILEKLIENEYNVILVVTQPDKQKDRKGNLLFTKTKEVAVNNNIEVLQLTNIKEEYPSILEYKPDIIITCAYGQIIPQQLIDYPEYGCINVHGSVLPKLRGGAPIHHAIIDGYDKTGITIMYMDKGMDSGDIISTKEIPILDSDNLDSLYEKMTNLGSELLLDTLPSIFNKTNNRIKQDESQVTFGLNITKEEEKIDFNRSARDIFNQIRGLSSVPGAYCFLDNKRLKIFKSEIINKEYKENPGTIVKVEADGFIVSTKDYGIKILDIQLEGKKRCLVSEYLNGIKKEMLVSKELK